MHGSSQLWATSVDGAIRIRSAGLAAGLRFGPEQYPEPRFGVGVDLGRWGELEIHWQRHYLVFASDILWHDQAAHLALTGQREGMGGWLALTPLPRVRAEVSLQRQNWVRDREFNPNTTLEPWGYDLGYHGFIAYEAERWSGRVGSRGYELDLQAYGEQGSLPYAKITRADLDLQSVFAAVEHHARWIRLLAEAERMDFTGYARGHVEFWPLAAGVPRVWQGR